MARRHTMVLSSTARSIINSVLDRMLVVSYKLRPLWHLIEGWEGLKPVLGAKTIVQPLNHLCDVRIDKNVLHVCIMLCVYWHCFRACGDHQYVETQELHIFKSRQGMCLATQLATTFVLTKHSPTVLFWVYF
jgi:hypothetical protein